AAHGLLNVEFTRVEDLAESLAQSAIREHGGSSLTRLKGTELVRTAVADSGAGGVFAGLVANPSFLSALQRTLRVLEAEQGAGITVSLSRLPHPSAITRAIGDIWERYQRLKSEHRLFDRTQVAGWASDSIRSGALEQPWARLAVGRLVVLAVATPAPQYRRLWRTLVDLPGAVVVAGVTGDERSDSVLNESLGLRIDRAGFPRQERGTPPPDIVSAADARSEAGGLVQRIVAAADAGVPFNRIAVYYGDQSYAARVRAALSLAGIPVSGQPPGTLLATPAGRFVNGVLEMALSDLARQKVGDWLATSPIKNPETGIPVTGTEWDRISRAARISSGVERWRSQLERFSRSRRFRAEQIEQYGEDDDSGGPRRSDALRAEADEAERLLKFVSTLAGELEHPESQTWTAWADWLKGTVDRYLDAPSGSGAAETAARVRTLLDRIGELDSLSSRYSGPKPDLARFAAVVARELSAARSGSQRLGRGVFVASVRDAAATQFEHVHILGMADGSFPSPDRADPLLPDHVKEELNSLCGISLPLSAMRLSLSRREFMTALKSGRRATLYWSRSSGPGADDAGPAQWLVEQARRQPGGESVQAGDLLRRPETVPGLSLVEYGVGEAASDIHEYEIASVMRHVETQRSSVRHLLEGDRKSGVPAALELERGRYGAALSHWSGDVSAAAAVLPSTSGEVLSASRVESFATCPLRYFFGYVLSVDPVVRAEDDFHMPPDRKGTFIHSVLELYLNLRLADGKPSGEATLDEAMQVAVAQWVAKEPDAAGRVWEIETGEIRRQLRRWLAAERALAGEGYRPSDAELSFGRASAGPGGPGLPPLEVELADGTALRFSGVIDRVERRDDGSFYVLDYKTGTPGSYTGVGDDPVDRGKHLQLALYSKAIEQFRPSETRPIAGYWFVLDGRQRILPDADTFDPDAASEGLATVLEMLHATNAGGHFPPNPGKRGYDGSEGTFDNCRYCDFDRVCPASSLRERMLKGHTEDRRLAPYFNLALDRDGDAQ
ncbi:MAG: PD-(D/E)XK nuclease family protein, partial [Chloroflexi bacterium]|nr:PD-(D/E)XK nuclease family protein [Chloroflexota bacterium]